MAVAVQIFELSDEVVEVAMDSVGKNSTELVMSDEMAESISEDDKRSEEGVLRRFEVVTSEVGVEAGMTGADEEEPVSVIAEPLSLDEADELIAEIDELNE